jgi:hypothetical protein
MPKLYKILSSTEKHHGLQYSTGLNIDPIPFNDNPEASCCPGGIYFAEVQQIFKFLDYGPYIREVTLPDNAKVVKDPQGDKYRASQVILGNRESWADPEVFKRLLLEGADVHANYDEALRGASRYGHRFVVKLLKD